MNLPNSMRSLIAVVRSGELAGQIDAYCAAAPDIAADIKVLDEAVSAAPAIINGGADIVLIEAGPNADIAALEELCAYVARGGSFIVIMEDPTTDVVRRLFRAGVTDVLPTPVMPNELTAALNTARGRRVEAPGAAPAAANGKIVSVLKTAGGVGATTFAVNAGAALARNCEGRIALVDLDVQFGQVATSLDVSPRMTILDALRAGKRLDPTLLASTMHQHQSGLKILAAPAEITPLEAVNEEFIDRLLANLRATAAISIIEAPAAWSQWVGHLLDKSDLIVPVAESTVRSAAGAARINQSFVDFGLTRPIINLVVNKYEKTIENNERAKKLGEIFRVKPAGAVRLDVKTAQDAADRGILFSDASAKSLAAKDFETNARTIAAAIGVELAQETEASAPFAKLLGGRLAPRGRQA